MTTRYTLDYDAEIQRILTIPHPKPMQPLQAQDSQDDYAALWLFPGEARYVGRGEATYSLPARLDVINRLRRHLPAIVIRVIETPEFKAIEAVLLEKRREELGLHAEERVIPCAARFEKTLYGVQNRMVNFALKQRFVLMAGEPGLGKTLTSLVAATQMLDQGVVQRWLVLCPATATLGTWAPEMQDARIYFRHVSTQPDYFSAAPFTLVTPDQLLVHLRARPALLGELARSYQGVIADDLEALGNEKTQIYQALASLRQSARSIIILDGTPILSRLQQLWCRVDLLQPGLLGAWDGFRMRNGIMDQQAPDRSRIERILQGELAGVVFAARLTDIGRELPPLIEHNVVVPLTWEQQEAYGRLQATFQGVRPGKEQLKLYARAQLIASDMGLTHLPYQPGASAKRDELGRLLPTLTGGTRKVMVYAQSRRWVYGLERFFARDHPGVIIAGDVALSTRREALERFRSDPKVKVLWITDAGSRAITVHEAQTVITAELPWSSTIYQTVARIRRGDEKEEKHWIRLMADCPLERHKWRLIQAKKELLNETVMRLPDLIKAGRLEPKELYI